MRFYGFFSGQAGDANSVYSGNSDSKFIIKNQPGYNFFMAVVWICSTTSMVTMSVLLVFLWA
ncbi:hypothetical protein HBZC1_10100 [Helicobacter bizzozeronii CIII-1]|uniref:Uncharacterized protein n=1 Tax=Helicobacter bizzozeronii (strain CIII-1) TaxID=1002804 RepID=F8KT49_HELBC|nr:hypothetical protein HBZC1_10100 [Helicobacter bizzozeronii CIII-1]